MTRRSKRVVKMNREGKPAQSETEKQGLRDAILSHLGPLASQKSILIADDEEALGQLLSSELTSRGYVCVSLGSKTDAYKWSLQHHPDLIITDIKSPGMDGFQFVRLLKSNTETKRVPIVFFTGVASDENTEMAVATEPRDYRRANWRTSRRLSNGSSGTGKGARIPRGADVQVRQPAGASVSRCSVRKLNEEFSSPR